jgi:hypothetical protein
MFTRSGFVICIDQSQWNGERAASERHTDAMIAISLLLTFPLGSCVDSFVFHSFLPYRFNGPVIQQQAEQSVPSCAAACTQHTDCVDFSIKGGTTCQLRYRNNLTTVSVAPNDEEYFYQGNVSIVMVAIVMRHKYGDVCT